MFETILRIPDAVMIEGRAAHREYKEKGCFVRGDIVMSCEKQ